MTLNWQEIQTKWQEKWKDIGKANVSNKPKFMMIFAYPGISGFLHVGHMRGYSYTDAICRYERMQGKEVLFPIGTHASGNQAIAFANKVKNKDQDWLEYLKKNGCSEKTVSKLITPEAIIEYFNEVYINDYWKKFGFICDWDRFTCTTYPDYEKFIQWQFTKLKNQDLLIQKPYYAPACPTHGPVAVDPSETDISKGGNAEKNEYTLLKFKFGTDFIIAATLRPETVYGQTNLWINPEGKYVRVAVDGENWILSKSAAKKISQQKDDIIMKEDVKVADLLGKKATAPALNREIIILPAPFVDPDIGSGIVTSVPSHAPHDWIGLTHIKKNFAKFGLSQTDVEINPIPMIQLPKWGDHPAKEACTKYDITQWDQIDKLEEAKKELYKAEFHGGIMKNNCQEYSGKRVDEAKELVKAKLLDSGEADLFFDLSEEVICRCGETVFIKRIDDQWFIKYSDQEVTEKSKAHVNSMQVYPKEYQQHLPGILDWFSDRACARLGRWMGSKFPGNDSWTIEPISDSTLYPAYYIVSKYINQGELKVKDLTEEFFDYVFLGEGEGKKAWEEIKEEFDYFYPLDLNLGGKEHQTVHFPVFIMNHVAILPPEKWPQGIFANWWVTGKGSKISKSKGGAKPIPEAIEKYGVDAMRLYYAHIGSPHVDVVWDEDVVLNYKNALERIYTLVGEVGSLNGPKKTLDFWLLSKLQHHLEKIKEIMKEYNLRELASSAYYSMYDDLRWYVRRGGENQATITSFINAWTKVLNPLTPHLSEELNREKNLVSTALWPINDTSEHNLIVEAGEEMIQRTMEGIRNVIKLAKITPKKITLFIAQDWLYEVFLVVKRELAITRNIGEIMKNVLAEEKFKTKGKEIGKLVISLVKDPSKIPEFILRREDESNLFQESKEFLEKEFSAKIEIITDGNQAKALSALPGKVGILVE